MMMPDIHLQLESLGSRTNVKPDYVVAAKTARTATGQSDWLDLRDHSACGFVLDSDAGTGTTPTLDVKIQHSIDKAVIIDVASGGFTQVTTSSSQQEKNLKDLHRYVRAL